VSSSSAAIYSVNDDHRSRAESAAWAQFASATDSSDFCAGWLGVLCAQVERVSGALVVLGPDDGGQFAAAAVWPDPSVDMAHLAPVAERTLKERRGLVEGRRGEAATQVGYPIEVSGRLHGAVVLELAPRADIEVQRALRHVHWASAWLVDQFRQQALTAQARQLQRLNVASSAVATALQESRADAAAVAVVNELAGALHCERVSLAFEQQGRTVVAAISHTAQFDARTDLARAIADAMDEVLDLNVPVQFPPSAADAIESPAHAHLARLSGPAGAVCSVPLVQRGRAVGAISFERAEPFDADSAELARTLGLMLGPVLSLQREQQRPLWRRALERGHEGLSLLWTPGHPGAKLVAASLVIVLALLTLLPVPYRVASRTVVEGAVQRALTAPFDGYVAESPVRAGDTVRKGQLLARLDDRNLRLDQARYTAERAQADRKFRQAAAQQDRASMMVYQAQVEQAQAQLDLVEDKITRASISAPFDGVVVSGDLSQLHGAPVETGKVLYEVAPLDAYRVVMQVDERDVAELAAGQRGRLAITGLPHDTLDFTVSQLTPVATAQDGRNFFRVEARLDAAPTTAHLRPGMEGVGKVLVGERKLGWVWTHGLTDWLRLWLWKVWF
jgi:biotin carboxyl carrier protein